MATDGAWRLLVVGTDGCLRLWNLQKLFLEIETSVLPLLNKPWGQAEGALVPVRLLVSHICHSKGHDVLSQLYTGCTLRHHGAGCSGGCAAGKVGSADGCAL